MPFCHAFNERPAAKNALEPELLRAAHHVIHNVTAMKPARVLSDAIRDVKNATADRTDVVVDLREAHRMRLELLAAELEPVFADVPKDRVRLHVCWGNWNGPHQDDVAAEDILPILYEAKVGALSIPLGNPRHEHETVAFKKHKLPKDMLLIPGVIDVTTNYLEHPEVVANRICEAVAVVGDKERVIAGTDCGFGTFVGWSGCDPKVAWLKLEAMAQGARIASDRLCPTIFIVTPGGNRFERCSRSAASIFAGS